MRVAEGGEMMAVVAAVSAPGLGGFSSARRVRKSDERPGIEATANMLGTFAQFERRLISQRTKEALAVKKASGVRLGRPPTLPQAVVRRIQRQRARGDSLRKIAQDLDEAGVATAQGGARWYAATVRHVLLRTPQRSPPPLT